MSDKSKINLQLEKNCRNIVIHGFCKFENKGCNFNHDYSPTTLSPSQNSAAARKSFNKSNKAFEGLQNPSSSMPAPETLHFESMNLNETINSYTAPKVGGLSFQAATSITRSYDYNNESFSSVSGIHIQNYDYYSPDRYQSDMTTPGISPYNNSASQYSQQYSNRAQLDNYFSQYLLQNSQVPRQNLQYHLYTSPLPNVTNIPQEYVTIHNFFMDDNHREYLHRRNEACQQVMDPNISQSHKIPRSVHNYHTLCPLETDLDRHSTLFGYCTAVYKAIRSLDGKPYVLRRIENYQLGNESSISCIEAWRRIRHSNIVSVCEAFTTKAFGDTFYDFHPLSVTMASQYFAWKGSPEYGMNEDELWNCVCQLTSAIQAIHSSNLAVRVIEPSKILLTGTNRVRINCVGIMDMLTYDSNKTLIHLQQDDLWSFGQLILALSCGSLVALQNFPNAIEHLGRNYSPELKNVVLYLLSKPTNFKTIDDVVTMIAPKLLLLANSALHVNDRLEDMLSAELENGRLVRLVCKLGFINERPEFEMDSTWAETGDRYLLKLFRDYVFHQVSETGDPVINMAHVISCLNKLDVGIDEKIMLTSRDEQSCLIVSYKDLKHCVDSTFKELLKRKGKAF